MSSPSLLELPRELRDKILETAFCIPDLPPGRFPSVETDDYVDRKDFNAVEGNHNGVVRWQHTPPVPPSVPAMLTNRKLHDETKETLTRCPSTRCYEVDIRIVDDNEVWSKWLLVPSLIRRVEKITARLQLSWTDLWEYRDTGEGIFCMEQRTGWTSPTGLENCLHKVLERFLQHGPVGARSRTENQYNSIKLIDIDLVEPESEKFRAIAAGFQRAQPDSYSEPWLYLSDEANRSLEKCLFWVGNIRHMLSYFMNALVPSEF